MKIVFSCRVLIEWYIGVGRGEWLVIRTTRMGPIGGLGGKRAGGNLM
jgi:hypothetical protein